MMPAESPGMALTLPQVPLPSAGAPLPRVWKAPGMGMPVVWVLWSLMTAEQLLRNV